MGKVDLHTHSRCSDGSLGPAELVCRAAERGVTTLALTDHDSVEGLPEAEAEGGRSGVRILTGCEFDCLDERNTRMHFLGLGFDARDPAIAATLVVMRREREQRAFRIVAKCRALGFPITDGEVAEIAGGGSFGRPHVAMALLKRGCVATVEEAFDKYLRHGKPAYVDRPRLDPREAMRLVHAAGGMCAVAHPGLIETDDLRGVIERLSAAGMDGLEVYYIYEKTSVYRDGPVEKARAAVADLERIAREFGLVATGGSDFHGAAKPDVDVGECDVPESVAEAVEACLRRRAAGRRSPGPA